MVNKSIKEGKRREPRFYMKLAIEAMKNSVDELNKDAPSPRVGAVIVFPDGTHETAYRGEFREGDHAEYTLLDKKFRTQGLSDCWLFATLEPCGPGARKEPKLCCAERIANARIKKVWYGAQELNPKAKGGKTFLETTGVEVLPFDLDLHREIHDFNKDFNDWVETENTRTNRAKTFIAGPLQKAVKNTGIESLSKEALELYITKTNKPIHFDSDELINDLISKELLGIDEKTGKIIPTGDCLLLFGKSPRDKFPQASIKAKVDYGGGQEIDAESFDDALVLLPDKIKEWVKKVIPESINRSDFTREKVSHFPPEVVREAIINAIIHRDYSIRGAKVELEITPDIIEVRSPGEPVSPNTLKDLQNFTAVSQTRNPELAYIFNLMKFMEESGVGMDTYRRMREKHNLPLPVITYKKSNLIVAFPRTVEALKETGINALKKMADEEIAGYEWIKAQGEISAKDYTAKFGISSRTTSRHLGKMLDLNLIRTNGENPKSPKLRYIIT
jgi:ATP-dependent DNA helicase RecG